MSTLSEQRNSVRMWVLAKTDKGVTRFYNDNRNEWHVNLKFADLVEYDRAVSWLDEHKSVGVENIVVVPVTLTVAQSKPLLWVEEN